MGLVVTEIEVCATQDSFTFSAEDPVVVFKGGLEAF